MKLSIEQKYQIEYIKCPKEIKIMDAGAEYVFLRSGRTGAYIQRRALKISLPEQLELEKKQIYFAGTVIPVIRRGNFDRIFTNGCGRRHI